MNDIVVSLKNSVRKIVINRPHKKNAMTTDMYAYITKLLNEDAKNDNVVANIITGTGDYFSSGNDILNGIGSLGSNDNMEDLITRSNQIFENFVYSLINYPKLLIAVVNGPAIGIAVTMLPLCDVVYASERATFTTPFVKLGLVTEACSSYLLPMVLGKSKASEMLYLNHKLTAEEAYNFNFVSKVIPHNDLNDFIETLYKYGDIPVNSLKINKALVGNNFQELLRKTNKYECTALKKVLSSEEFINTITNFMLKKSKL